MPSAPFWRGSRTGTTRSDRTRPWAVRRRTRSLMDDVTPTAAGALSRGRGTRRRAPGRHHGRRPGPRLERDWTSWPRRSGARGTWRKSRSDGTTDWCPSDTVFAQGDVCLTSYRVQVNVVDTRSLYQTFCGCVSVKAKWRLQRLSTLGQKFCRSDISMVVPSTGRSAPMGPGSKCRSFVRLRTTAPTRVTFLPMRCRPIVASARSTRT